MNRVAAVVLAGGRGERLGGAVKANLTVGGIRLLDRVVAALGNIPHPILLSHGAISPHDIGPMGGLIPVPDLEADYAGPLAGLAGAVAWCLTAEEPPQLLLTVAVDTPFVPADFATRMAGAVEGQQAVVAGHGGQRYPTNAIWRLSAIADLPDRVREGTAPRSLMRLADSLGASSLEWPEIAGGDPFANANTPPDLEALAARARPR
jgi:molybdenum cofactor guanylyltransferase